MATLMIMVKKSEANTLDLGSGSKRSNLKNFINLLQQLRIGCAKGTVYVNSSSSDPVFASGTFTCTQASISADDTIAIGGTTLTAKVSGNGTTQFTIGASDSAAATNLAACINANTTINKYAVATAASGVVTVTCLYPGTIGNTIALASSNGTGIAKSSTVMASGAGGAASTQHTYSFT